MRIPFGCDRHGDVDVMLTGEHRIGDATLAREVVASLSAGPRTRYDVGLKVQTALGALLAGNCIKGPVYGLWGNRSKPHEGLVGLVLLPTFYFGARAITFFRPKADEPLRFLELWFSHDPRFGPVDPGSFQKEYNIAVDDELGFRQALIDVLKQRRAPDRTQFFYPGDENL